MDVRGALGARRRRPQRLHADPRHVPRQGRRARRRSCARSSSTRRRAPPCSTWSPTACPSTSTPHPEQPGRTHAPADARAPDLPRDRPTRPARASSRSPSGSPSELAAPRRRRTTATAASPSRASTRCERAGYFAAPVPAELGGLGVESLHDLVVASSRLARGDASLAIGVNMHLAVAAATSSAAGAGRGARRRAPRRRLRRLADARSSRDGASSPPRSASPARTSPARRRPPRAPTPAGAIDGAQGLLHDVAGGDRALHGRRVRRRRAAASATATRRSPPTRPASMIHDDWDALGMRASGSHSVTLRRRRAARVRAARRLPDRRRERLHGAQPHAPGCSTPPRRWASPSPPHETAAAAARAAATPTPARGCSSPRTRSTSAPRRASLSRAAIVEEHARATPGDGEDSRRCSPRPRRRRRSSTRPPCASSTARWRCPAAPATSTATRSRAPTATCAPARFMHPLGANRAYEFVGDVALGHVPSVH